MFFGSSNILLDCLNWVLGNAAPAAAKSLQSCPTLRPHRRQPTMSLLEACHIWWKCNPLKSRETEDISLLYWTYSNIALDYYLNQTCRNKSSFNHSAKCCMTKGKQDMLQTWCLFIYKHRQYARRSNRRLIIYLHSNLWGYIVRKAKLNIWTSVKFLDPQCL